MEQPSRTFHAMWAFLIGCLGLAALWLIAHRSDDPVVLQRYSVGYAIVLAGVIVALAAAILFKRSLYRHRLSLTLVCVSTIGSLASAEAVLRLIDPLGLSYFDEIARFQRDRLPDDVRGFRHRSSWREVYQGIDITLNEQGLRDDPIPRKAAGEYRLMMLGDSVTFGWGVRREETFPSVIEKSLRVQGGPVVRVINAGFPGYNTAQELAFFEESGAALEVDGVVLTYVMNDIEPRANHAEIVRAYRLDAKSPPDAAMTLLQQSWLVRLLVYFKTYAWADQSGGTSAQDIAGLRETRGWVDSVAALRQLAEQCTARRLPLLVVFFRFQQTPLGDQLLQDVRQAVGASPVIDAGEWYRHEPMQSVVNSRIDAHLNARGHRMFAAHTLEFIQSVFPLGPPHALTQESR